MAATPDVRPVGDLPDSIGKTAARELSLHGITTLETVAAHSKKELLAIHGVGPKAVAILGEALKEKGLTYRGMSSVSADENKRLMQDVFAAISRGNIEPLIAAMAEDMRWTRMGRWAHTFEGKKSVVNELFAGVKDTLSPSFEVIPHRFFAEGDHVVIEHSGRNTTLDGRPYHNNYCWVCRFGDGRLREIREYMDTELVTETFGKDQ